MESEELDEVYDFLMGPYHKRLEIQRKESLIAELRSCLLPGAIRYDADKVQSSPGDQLSEVMAKIDEMERQVGASLAVMTAAGTPTAQATTQLNSLIAELGKNGTIAANNLAKAAEGTQYGRVHGAPPGDGQSDGVLQCSPG